MFPSTSIHRASQAILALFLVFSCAAATLVTDYGTPVAYQILNRKAGKLLREDATANELEIYAAGASPSQTVNAYTVGPAANHVYIFENNANPNQVFTAQGNTAAAVVQFQAYSSGNLYQQWKYIQVYADWHVFQNVGSGLYAQLQQGGIADATRITQYYLQNGYERQEFLLILAP
jgi:hypothetical protein